MFSPIKSGRLYQQIGAQIIRLMQEGRLKAGEKLPGEHELSGMFDVSRATVREALIALETVGYIEVRNGTGAYVRPHLPATLTVPWNLGTEPDPGVFEQFQAREVVEPACATIAAGQITADEIAELERIVERMEGSYARSEDDRDGAAFHVQIALATRNLVLANVVKQLWAMREGPMWTVVRKRLLSPEMRQQAIAIRRRIIAAFKRGDGDAARAAMVDLLASSRERYFHGLEDRDPPVPPISQ